MVSRLNYRSMVPDGSFIANYMDSMADVETPYAYDFWCACWLLSVALGREIRIERPRAPVYMNLYAILTAESGVTRKSTAVKAATEIAQQFMQEHAPQMRMVQNATTPRKLLMLMNDLTQVYDTAQLVISVEELVTVLGKQHYQMPGFLTDYYDCPNQRTSGGSYGAEYTVNVRRAFVSLIGASTPSWLVDSITPAVIEGGFTSRCLFIVAEDRKRRVAWPIANDGVARRSMSDTLVGIHKRACEVNARIGGIPLSVGAIEDFTSWYNTRDEHRDPFRASFEAREDHHVLRLAGFLCASDGTWEIQYTHIRQAIKIIRAIKEDAANLFAKHAPVGKTVAGVGALVDRLIGAGKAGLSQAQLGGMVQRYMTREHLHLVLAIMLELELVQKFEYQPTKYSKTVTLWRATKHITKRGAQAMVLTELERALTEAANRSIVQRA